MMVLNPLRRQRETPRFLMLSYKAGGKVTSLIRRARA